MVPLRRVEAPKNMPGTVHVSVQAARSGEAASTTPIPSVPPSTPKLFDVHGPLKVSLHSTGTLTVRTPLSSAMSW